MPHASGHLPPTPNILNSPNSPRTNRSGKIRARPEPMTYCTTHRPQTHTHSPPHSIAKQTKHTTNHEHTAHNVHPPISNYSLTIHTRHKPTIIAHRTKHRTLAADTRVHGTGAPKSSTECPHHRGPPPLAQPNIRKITGKFEIGDYSPCVASNHDNIHGTINLRNMNPYNYTASSPTSLTGPLNSNPHTTTEAHAFSHL